MSETRSSWGGSSGSQQPERAVYRIDNMNCKNAEALVRKSLGPIDGVGSLEFDLENRTLGVTHSMASLDSLEDALRSIGMHATRQESDLVRANYSIGNMDCPSAEALIRAHPGRLGGVEVLQLDLTQRTLAVTHVEQARLEMESVLAAIGLKATVRAGDSHAGGSSWCLGPTTWIATQKKP